MSGYFPLFFHIEQKRFRVFGAGSVAARRVEGLLRHGAFVTVAAPRIDEGIRALEKQYPGTLVVEQRAYRMSEIQDDETDYVLAATDDPQVNLAICRECRHKNIPVNNASDRSACDFYFPALAEEENIIIGVASTDGDHERVARVGAALREILKEITDER